ncbi:MAG: hypothetical protein V3S24_11155 [Candidatus Tectomicrobia bacterium]
MDNRPTAIEMEEVTDAKELTLEEKDGWRDVAVDFCHRFLVSSDSIEHSSELTVCGETPGRRAGEMSQVVGTPVQRNAFAVERESNILAGI